jgi:hypothetical protein
MPTLARLAGWAVSNIELLVKAWAGWKAAGFFMALQKAGSAISQVGGSTGPVGTMTVTATTVNLYGGAGAGTGVAGAAAAGAAGKGKSPYGPYYYQGKPAQTPAMRRSVSMQQRMEQGVPLLGTLLLARKDLDPAAKKAEKHFQEKIAHTADYGFQSNLLQGIGGVDASILQRIQASGDTRRQAELQRQAIERLIAVIGDLKNEGIKVQGGGVPTTEKDIKSRAKTQRPQT